MWSRSNSSTKSVLRAICLMSMACGAPSCDISGDIQIAIQNRCKYNKAFRNPAVNVAEDERYDASHCSNGRDETSKTTAMQLTTSMYSAKLCRIRNSSYCKMTQTPWPEQYTGLPQCNDTVWTRRLPEPISATNKKVKMLQQSTDEHELVDCVPL